MSVSVRITRGTIVAPGQEAAAGELLQVAPLVAHALLCAGAAELVDAGDLAAVHTAVRAESTKLARQDRQQR